MAGQPRIIIIPIKPKRPFPSRAKMTAALFQAVNNVVAEGTRFIAEYPTKRAVSGYRRTGTLKRSWSPVAGVTGTKRGFGRIEGTVGSNTNIAPYARVVQGRNQEPHFLFLGWRNVEELGRRMQNDLEKEAQAAIDKVFA